MTAMKRLILGGAFVTTVMSAFDARAQPAVTAEAPTLRAGSDLETTALGRDWLKYVIRCALPHGKSLDIPHDGTRDRLDGEFGLAPDWSHAPLDDSGRRWISACVLGFVNALGEHVFVSMRGAQTNLKATVDDTERRSFAYQEAAFYGDLFATPPIGYVCRGTGGQPVSPSRDKRLCSDPSERAGLSRCGMILTGNCADVCAGEDATDHFYTRCRGGDRVFDEVVTVFLRSYP